MNKKRGSRPVAVIDIGSNVVKMRIAQLQGGECVDLDRLEYPVNLGHEVFGRGKISFESLKELSSILHGFSQVMTEYGVTQYRAVATTVFREAENRAYILDQLKIQNNMNVTVLEDDQEKTLIYSEILRSLEDMPPAGALISYIGTGSIGVALYEPPCMVFSQNIPMGSLKLHDMLGSIQQQTTEFYQVLDEYLSNVIRRLCIPRLARPIETVVIASHEFELIAKLCGASLKKNRYVMDAALVGELYKTIRNLPAEKIGMMYGISDAQAESLYSALAIYLRLLTLTSAKTVISPRIELWDALIRQLLFPKSGGEYEAHVRQGALSCARALALRYQSDETHCERVREYACLLFDKMKKVHGLSLQKKTLLELACLLHECGYYVNSKSHLTSSYDLVRNTGLYGLTAEEVLLVATITRYNAYTYPRSDDPEYALLSQKNRLVVSKLAALFQLANALDTSQKQKLHSLKVRLKEGVLTVSGETDENAYLEKWAFETCAPFFEEVFGIKPQFVIKSLLF